MDSYDIKKLKGLYALGKYMSERHDQLKDPYVEVLSIDQRKHGTSYIEDEIRNGTYITELPELTDSKFFKNIGSAVKYSEKLMEKDYIDDVYISVNIFLYDKVSYKNVLNMFSFSEFEHATQFELAYIHGWDLEHPIENDYADRKILENVGRDMYHKKINDYV
mgnify:FL=1